MAIAAMSALSPDTVVHVVVPAIDHDDTIKLERNDADPPARRRSRGAITASWPTSAASSASSIKMLAPEVLELVRPTRIDGLKVTGVAVTETVLHEGDGLRLMIPAATAPTHVTLTGEIWSDPVRRELVATDAFSRATAAWVFGLDDHHELSEPEQMRVAMYGRAVSPVTSYVAAEPGTRPSTIGLGNFGTVGYGAGGGGMAGYGIGVPVQVPDLATMIDTRACVRDHVPPKGWRVALDIETTKDEIVDVSAPGESGAFAACLVEAAWAVEIGSRFTDVRRSFVVELAEQR